MVVYVVYKDNEENTQGDYMQSIHLTLEGATTAITKLKSESGWRGWCYFHIAEEKVEE